MQSGFSFSLILPFKSNSLCLVTVFHQLVTQHLWTLTHSLPFFWFTKALLHEYSQPAEDKLANLSTVMFNTPHYWEVGNLSHFMHCMASRVLSRAGELLVVSQCFGMSLSNEWIVLFHFHAQTPNFCSLKFFICEELDSCDYFSKCHCRTSHQACFHHGIKKLLRLFTSQFRLFSSQFRVNFRIL